jgi:chromosome partitioning related protein ParA
MVLSIISTKGGAGKTTLSANLAGYLSSTGKKVLMIDADSQPSLSRYFEITNQALSDDKNSSLGLVEFLSPDVNPKDCISQTKFGDIILSNDNQHQVQPYILGRQDGRFRLKIALDQIKDNYDYVIIDTQGSQNILSESAVLASDRIISPANPDLVSTREFNHSTLNVISSLDYLKSLNLNIPEILAIVYKTTNTKNSKQFGDFIRSKAKEHNKYQMLNAEIPLAVSYMEAANYRIPVTDFDNKEHNFSNKQKLKAQKSSDAIKELVKELGLC